MNKYIIIFCVIVCCLGCNSFKPQIVPGWPDECNAMATIMDFEYSDKEKKLAAGVIPVCVQAFKDQKKERKRDRCRREYFGINPTTKAPNPVVYTNLQRYRDYEQCKKE